MTLPSASSTEQEVKFSLGMSASDSHCRRFSCSMISKISGSSWVSGWVSRGDRTAAGVADAEVAGAAAQTVEDRVARARVAGPVST